MARPWFQISVANGECRNRWHGCLTESHVASGPPLLSRFVCKSFKFWLILYLFRNFRFILSLVTSTFVANSPRQLYLSCYACMCDSIVWGLPGRKKKEGQQGKIYAIRFGDRQEPVISVRDKKTVSVFFNTIGVIFLNGGIQPRRNRAPRCLPSVNVYIKSRWS